MHHRANRVKAVKVFAVVFSICFIASLALKVLFFPFKLFMVNDLLAFDVKAAKNAHKKRLAKASLTEAILE